MVLAGIDGGATRTRAVLVSGDGAVLGYGESGSSNYDNVGIVIAQKNIGSAVDQAWTVAGQPARACDAAFLGMAGVVSGHDRQTIHKIASAIGLANDGCVGVDHDLRIALAGGLAGNEGLVLIVGTGSSCYGRRSNGRHHRTGWGYLLDDLGSGYFLGLQAMIATIRAADGRGRRTSLSRRIQQLLGFTDTDDIMRILYHDSPGVTGVAALAPAVLEEAKAGDDVALAIADRGADELSLMVETVAKKLEFPRDGVSLVIVGGVAEQSTFYRERIESAVLRRVPYCRIQQPLLSPILGAALLAFEQAGIQWNSEIIHSLQESSTVI